MDRCKRCAGDLEAELSRRVLLAAADARAQRHRDLDRAILALVVLHDRDHETWQSEAGTIQQVRVFERSAGLTAVADVPSLPLERAAVAARRDLEPLAHSRRPCFDVESTPSLEGEIAGAKLQEANR